MQHQNATINILKVFITILYKCFFRHLKMQYSSIVHSFFVNEIMSGRYYYIYL